MKHMNPLKQLITAIVLCLLCDEASSADLHASEEGADMSIVRGGVLMHTGDMIIVKDLSGKDVSLRITPQTLMPGLQGGRFRPGDRVEVQVTKDRQAMVVRPGGQR